MSSKSRVTVGMPVYNGDNYLAETLDSIVAQSYQNFEVVISDNGSTDGTERICREYAAKDPRLQYHRSDDESRRVPEFQTYGRALLRGLLHVSRPR